MENPSLALRARRDSRPCLSAKYGPRSLVRGPTMGTERRAGWHLETLLSALVPSAVSLGLVRASAARPATGVRSGTGTRGGTGRTSLGCGLFLILGGPHAD